MSVPTSIETFKGDNINLKGKVFTIGPDQASRYDSTMKAIIGYGAEKFDHRVIIALKNKSETVAENLTNKPKAPTKKDSNDVEIIDKDGKAYVEYQMKLKMYLS